MRSSLAMRSRLALLLLALSFSSAAAQEGSFYDSFKRLDPERWQLSDGWTNGEHQACVWSERNIRLVKEGVELSLTNVPYGVRPYSCGELMSRSMFGYGTYEVRMKPAPAHAGVVSAFFTYTGPPHGNPHDEVDFEFVGTKTNSVDATFHANGKSHEKDVPLDFDARAGFNDYAFHWSPHGITWFANGKVIRHVKRAEVENFPVTPGKLYISIWNGTPMLDSWLGHFSYPGTPLVATYAYIAYTKLGDDCQFPQSLVCTLGKDGLDGR
jgi:endo-1,3-1,4-beta-glycanase ExoK